VRNIQIDKKKHNLKQRIRQKEVKTVLKSDGSWGKYMMKEK